MKKLFTTINDIKIFRSQITDRHTQWRLPVKTCVICEKEIKDCEKISLLMCNDQLFPNVWVHDSHITDKYNPEWTIKYIASKYQKYLSHANERKIWKEI